MSRVRRVHDIDGSGVPGSSVHGAPWGRRDPRRRTGAVTLSMAGAMERARGLAVGGGRVLLGITGPPGGGKSTLARLVATELGDAARIVGMDGFHLAQAELVRLGRE